MNILYETLTLILTLTTDTFDFSHLSMASFSLYERANSFGEIHILTHNMLPHKLSYFANCDTLVSLNSTNQQKQLSSDIICDLRNNSDKINFKHDDSLYIINVSPHSFIFDNLEKEIINTYSCIDDPDKWNTTLVIKHENVYVTHGALIKMIGNQQNQQNRENQKNNKNKEENEEENKENNKKLINLTITPTDGIIIDASSQKQIDEVFLSYQFYTRCGYIRRMVETIIEINKSKLNTQYKYGKTTFVGVQMGTIDHEFCLIKKEQDEWMLIEGYLYIGLKCKLMKTQEMLIFLDSLKKYEPTIKFYETEFNPLEKFIASSKDLIEENYSEYFEKDYGEWLLS